MSHGTRHRSKSDSAPGSDEICMRTWAALVNANSLIDASHVALDAQLQHEECAMSVSVLPLVSKPSYARGFFQVRGWEERKDVVVREVTSYPGAPRLQADETPKAQT